MSDIRAILTPRNSLLIDEEDKILRLTCIGSLTGGATGVAKRHGDRTKCLTFVSIKTFQERGRCFLKGLSNGIRIAITTKTERK